MTTPDDTPRPVGSVFDGLMAGMPAHLIEVGQGRAQLSPEDMAHTDRLFAEMAAADASEQAALREEHLNRIWDRCCPAKYRAATLASLHPQQDPTGKVLTATGLAEFPNAVTTWLDGDVPNLFLQGMSRRGKSYAAYAVGNQARERGLYVAAWSTPALVDALRGLRGDDENARALRDIDDAEIFLMDDVGQEHVTDSSKVKIWQIGESRITQAGRRTVYTSNLTYDELIRVYGEPPIERALESAVIAVIEGLKLSTYERPF